MSSRGNLFENRLCAILLLSIFSLVCLVAYLSGYFPSAEKKRRTEEWAELSRLYRSFNYTVLDFDGQLPILAKEGPLMCDAVTLEAFYADDIISL